MEATDSKALANMVITTASVCSSRGCTLTLPLERSLKHGKTQAIKWVPRTRAEGTTTNQLSQLELSQPDGDRRTDASLSELLVDAGQVIGENEAGLPEDVAQDTARIPVLVNSKPLQPGQYLYYFQKKKDEGKRERVPEPITITHTLRKKGRHSRG